MHVAAFIGKPQHYKNFKPSYLSIGKWAISPFLSDQVTYDDHEWFDNHDGLFAKVASYTSSRDCSLPSGLGIFESGNLDGLQSGKFAPQEDNPLYSKWN